MFGNSDNQVLGIGDSHSTVIWSFEFHSDAQLHRESTGREDEECNSIRASFRGMRVRLGIEMPSII